jgi:hypothetical protein
VTGEINSGFDEHLKTSVLCLALCRITTRSLDDGLKTTILLLWNGTVGTFLAQIII